MYRSKGETCITDCYPEHGYVIKRFRPRKPKFGLQIDPLRESLDLCFYREKTCLERLHDSPRFPNLIDSDRDNLTIKMSWVGYPFLHFAQHERDTYLSHAEQIVKDLKDADIKLAYEWTPGDNKPRYCLSMMMVNGEDLNLIDFERAWPVGCDRQNEFNEKFIQSFDKHDDTEFLKRLKHDISKTDIIQPPKGRYETE